MSILLIRSVQRASKVPLTELDNVLVFLLCVSIITVVACVIA